MAERQLGTAEVLALLQENPARIEQLTVDLSPAQLQAAPAPGEWSLNDILAHLRACADVWGDCIATTLAEDTPMLRAINPRTWIKQTGYPALEFQTSLRSFAT